MDFLKFSAITVIQFIIFFILMLIGAKFKYEINKKARKIAGVEKYRRVSITAQLIFLFGMVSLIFLIFEISTLVLSSHVFMIFFLTLIALGFLSLRLISNMSFALRQLILPHENPKLLSVMLSIALIIFTMSLAIELNFLMSSNTQIISAEIISIKPARLSSPIRSVRVNVPPVEFNNNTSGVSFFRFDSQKDQNIDLGKINVILLKGKFGLYRALPLKEQSFLKGNFLSY